VLWAAAFAALLTVFLGSYLAHLNLAASGFLSGVRALGTDQGRMVAGPGWWHWLAAGVVLLLAVWSRGHYAAMPTSARRWILRAWAALGVQAGLGLILLATALDGPVLVAHEALGVATTVLFVAAAVCASTDAPGSGRVPGRA
jgi:heme A synthase